MRATRHKRRTRRNVDIAKLLTHLSPRSPAAEAFRALRTNLQFLASENPVKSIAVVSAGPEEGKSLTAANLGITLAAAGGSTLIVDADLRRPVQHELFGLSGGIGLTHVLAGMASIEEALQPANVENLSVCAAGPLPPNPAELLGSERMRKTLTKLEQRFDHIVVDTAPLLAVTDAAIVGAQVDGVLFQVRAGSTDYRAGHRAAESLEKAGATTLGVVLGDVGGNRRDGYYYYHYYSGDSR